MSRKDQFLWVVQTGCLSRAMKEGWDMGEPIRIMSSAVKVPEEAIPEDLDAAAFEFLKWQFKYGSVGEEARPPDWLVPFVRGTADETGYWRFG